MFAILLYLQEGLAFKNRLSGTEGAIYMSQSDIFCLRGSLGVRIQVIEVALTLQFF